MMALKSSVSDTIICSIYLESSIMILEASFDDQSILIVQATEGVGGSNKQRSSAVLKGMFCNNN
jgi:hypothetical protein